MLRVSARSRASGLGHKAQRKLTPHPKPQTPQTLSGFGLGVSWDIAFRVMAEVSFGGTALQKVSIKLPSSVWAFRGFNLDPHTC